MELNKNERIDDLGINNLKIIQNKEYFCFGTDSVLLANFVESNSSKNTILDLCSGSGVIPILLTSKVKYNKILSVEIQDEMYNLLQRNLELNNLKNDIFVLQDNVVNYSNILKYIKENLNKEYVDIITVNPPYKEKGRGIINEDKVKYIARHEELCTLEDIFKTSSKLLKDKGKLYMVNKPERLVDLLAIARKYNLEAKKIKYVYPKVNMKPSIVLIEYVKYAGNEVIIMPPFIEYGEDGNYTREMKEMCKMEGLNG